jgi:PTS system galactitol-specific IIC component
MPLTLGVAFILPGNQVFPMLDLLAIPYIIQPIIAVSNGNIIKSVISGLIYTILLLYSCTMTGPILTEVAAMRGVDFGGAAMITSFAILGHPVPAVFFMIFTTLNPILITLSVVVYAIAYVLVRKNKPKIHEWIEKVAAKSASIAE